MQNQITVKEIYATACKGQFTETLTNPTNIEFFNKVREDNGFEALQHLINNLALTYFGYQVDIETEDNGFPNSESIDKVYSAAKVIFAMFPDKPFEFDIDSTLGGIGSPWERQCANPEEWVICWSRRYLETDEGVIDEVNRAVLLNALTLLGSLVWVGVPQQAIEENLAYLCYDNEDLISRVKFS